MMARRRYRYRFPDRELRLDAERKKLGGVCAGLANYLGTEPLFLRIAALISLCIFPEATLLSYGIAYMVLDQDDQDFKEPVDDEEPSS